MSGFDPLIDINRIEGLAKDPRQMATLLLQIEKRAKEWKIGTDPQRRASLVAQLQSAIALSETDAEEGHQMADDVLLEFINDEEISDLFGRVKKFYAD